MLDYSNMRLKKYLGQHLLVARGVIEHIAQLIDPKEGEVLVEIGPGTGNLTMQVLKYPFKELHLVEFDLLMVRMLQQEIKDPRVRIHWADAVEFDYCSLGDELKVFGNLPYNRASLIVERSVFCHMCIREAVYMVQKEVGEKLQKGTSWLSTFLKTFYEVEYLMSLPARFFFPTPKVQSALIRLKRRESLPNLDLKDYKLFLTKLYAERRKALKNKLPEELLLKAGVNPMARVETLSPEEVFLLYNMLKKSEVE